MKRFLGGVAVASLAWVGVLYAQSSGAIDPFGFFRTVPAEEPAAPPGAKVEMPAGEPGQTQGRKARRKPGRRSLPGPAERAPYDSSDAVSGADLGALEPREVDVGAGGREEQLSGAEIERGVDGVFRGIERCLVLLPPDAPAAGKVVVGMRIAKSGLVTEVNLKGPRPLVDGEPGACIRRVVRSIRYRSFDGPDMVAHYPIMFE